MKSSLIRVSLRWSHRTDAEDVIDTPRPQVFHGAESDIVWLQENFGIYVVGLFDTYHASKILGKCLEDVASG